MKKEDLQKKIKHLADVLVVLPSEQKERILKSLPVLTEEQLEKLEAALLKAFHDQTELLKKGFLKNPAFAQKFTAFQETQVQKAQSEAANAKSRDSMKDYLNFKAEWRKKM